MKRYLTTIALISLVGCSSQVPNGGYYQNLAYYNNNVRGKEQYAQRYRDTTAELKETLYKEREWSKRQLAQKDATIEGLRKELYQTRTYVSELMSQLSAVNREQQRAIPLYEQESSYEQVEYSGQQSANNIIYVSASPEVREPITRSSLTIQEDSQEVPALVNPTPRMTPPVQDIVEPQEENKIPLVSTPAQEQVQSAPSPVQEKKSAKDLKRSSQTRSSKVAYEEAMDVLKQKQYERARTLFDAFIKNYPKDALLPNAWYWKGETFYSLADYAQAVTTFMHIVNTYPKSHKAPDALLKIVMCYSALKDTANARKYKEALINSYPKSSSAKKVKQMVL